jgi:DNA-binding transcriptional LysR family regulator
MELRQIRSFLSVAETLHFGRSAQQQNISQPALSLQIRALEDELGVRLLDRNRRRTSLTVAGTAFRAEAIQAMARLEEAVRKAKLAAKGQAGSLRIGFISTAGAEILPEKIRQFRAQSPDVAVSLRNILSEEQVKMLLAGTLDVGFVRLPIGEHPELETVRVHREPFVLVVPKTHRLADKQRVRLAELADEDFVMYERQYAPGFHDVISGMLRNAGIIPRISQTAGEMPTLISLVDSGMGVAILPQSALLHRVANVVQVSITDKIPVSEIALAVRRGERTPVVENFRTLVLGSKRRSGDTEA